MAKANKFRAYERKADQALTPVEYSGLQKAFDHFNATLFDQSLPDIFFTYQRKANSAGSFMADEFSDRVGNFSRDGIRLNPDIFVGQTDAQILQNLVHQMCHEWQKNYGKPPARHYHDRQWADKMKSIGLQPTSTGGVDGKETGARISDYVIPDGPFERAYENLAASGWRLNLQSAPREGPKNRVATGKTKFTCDLCGYNVWAKPPSPTAFPLCGACSVKKHKTVVMRTVDADVAAAPAAYEPKPAVDEPVKPKRGRPKGSKNKPTATVAAPIESYEPKQLSSVKRKPGRPKGSKNKEPKAAPVAAIQSYEQLPILRGRGGDRRSEKFKAAHAAQQK
jgi:hypothetical protein